MTSHYGALAPTTIMLMVMEMIMTMMIMVMMVEVMEVMTFAMIEMIIKIVVEIEYHPNKHMKMMVVVKDVAVQMRKAVAS